jgi:predicted esterase
MAPETARPQLNFEHVFQRGESEWTLLLLHGTGGDEHDLVGLGRQLAPHASLLSPRGRVLENGMPRFFRRLAVGQLDIPDLLERTDQLAAFVGGAAGAYGLSLSTIVAVGLSNGANIAASVLMRHPDVLRGAALLRPMLPYEPDQAPAFINTDVLIDAGDDDPYSSAEQVQRLGQILSGGGARVVTHTEPGAGHGLTQNDLRATSDWLSRLLHQTR